MKRGRLLAVILVIMLLTGIFSACSQEKEAAFSTVLHFIDVGKADSILIVSGNAAMLIDAGNNADTDEVIAYIQSQGISKLDYVIGTHPHEDHIGGLDGVIETFSIGKIIMPDIQHDTQTFKDVLTAISAKKLTVTAPVPGTTYPLGDGTFTILAPNGENYDSLNDYSVVVKFQHGENTFLLTGDAGNASENEMLSAGYDLSAKVLKVAHHGSDSATSEAFLAAVKPAYAVISVGADTDGLPADETIARLEAEGIQILRTDEMGTICISSDGKTIKIGS